MTSKLTHIQAREILDSRGNPTIEVTVWSGDANATASVPSGASTGKHEAHELRDGGQRYHGLGVTKACRNVEKLIAPHVLGMEAWDQERIDRAMIALDGTANKSRLGANAILAVSLATARLHAILSGSELYQTIADLGDFPKFRLPQPLFNVINGGKHADSGLDIQEFFLIPKADSFRRQLEIAHTVIYELKHLLQAKHFSIGLGDEGGFAPHLANNESALRLLTTATEKAGFIPGRHMFFGLDAAASEFYDDLTDTYQLSASHKTYKPVSISRLYRSWQQKYALTVLEDGCAEDDIPGWQHLTSAMGDDLLLVGDDLFVTNPQRLQAGIIAGIANAVLIKPNQIGTLTETLETIALAQKFGYQIVISHRSGETTDDFIADLAVGVGAQYMKAGSLARGERLAKYNRLAEIESLLK